MPRVCYFTGKKTTFGNQITHRGKAKYLGGVGTKVTGITARKFRPNIQKVRALINGRIVRIKVSTKAIRNRHGPDAERALLALNHVRFSPVGSDAVSAGDLASDLYEELCEGQRRRGRWSAVARRA